LYLAHICAEALRTSLLARVCTSPRKRGEGAASRVGKGALLRAVPTNCDLWWARGACHRAGRTGPASGRPDGRLRPDPLALPTLRLTHPPAPRSARGQLVLVFLEKFVLGHFLFDDIGELDDEVHHLFLKNRRPHSREGIVILLVVVPHFALAPGILPRPLHDGTRDFIVIDLDVVLVADFRKNKAEADPPVGYGAVLFARLVLGRALLLESPVLRLEVRQHGIPDIGEFLLDQGRRRLEFVEDVKLVQELPFELLPARAGVFLSDPLLDGLLELVQRLYSERSHQGVIAGQLFRPFARLGHDLERRGLTGELLGRVIGGKPPVYAPALPRPNTHHMVPHTRTEN